MSVLEPQERFVISLMLILHLKTMYAYSFLCSARITCNDLFSSEVCSYEEDRFNELGVKSSPAESLPEYLERFLSYVETFDEGRFLIEFNLKT